jgi:hypothetical protein
MSDGERLIGRVQPGKGDASRWLSRFNAAYTRKVGMPVFPRSLNLALPHVFDWSAPAIRRRTVWFGREEYGGERDVLLVPCRLVNLPPRTGRRPRNGPGPGRRRPRRATGPTLR